MQAELSLSVLVIEDDPTDFLMLKRALRDEAAYSLCNETTLQRGLRRLTRDNFDLILLDLYLPDSQGQSTITSITDASSLPVVVLSGSEESDTDLQAVRNGAHDYLFKSNMDTLLISRTIRYAVERYSLLKQLHETRERSRRGQELRRLELNTELNPTNTKFSTNPATLPMKSTYPDDFAAVVELYTALLHHTLQKREYQTKHVNVSKQLKRAALHLGECKATPKDAIEVHTTSVNAALKEIAPQKDALCHQEARYLLSGLLGHLCYLYRFKAFEFTNVEAKTSSP